MKVITVRNVNYALPEGLRFLNEHGTRSHSRNGDVIKAVCPVTTEYLRPTERVIFSEDRDANPFFHLFESLWMLAGRDDVAYVEQFVKRMRTFSDDGVVLHGAYGKRWKKHFISRPYGIQIDQLSKIIHMLCKNREDRRAVLQMWDAPIDLGRNGKDVPCNVVAHFQVSEEVKLNMTVFCRSNDAIWGAYGANAVHFSALQEYVAAGVGIPVGTYWQISDNFHVYENVADKLWCIKNRIVQDHYSTYEVKPYPLVSIPLTEWNGELNMFLQEPTAIGFTDPFFRHVAIPMFRAHTAYKEGDLHEAFRCLGSVQAEDWQLAAVQWLGRRRKPLPETREAE